MTAPPTITEVKRKLDGSEERFATELVHRTPQTLLVLYRLRDQRGSLDSYGAFWRRRPYICYHMVRPPGAPDAGLEVRTRFDVVRNVRIEGDVVSYDDLLLDLWVRAGVAEWEDDDEVAAARAAGTLSPADLAYIERARALLDRRHRRVVAEIRGTLRTLGRIPA